MPEMIASSFGVKPWFLWIDTVVQTNSNPLIRSQLWFFLLSLLLWFLLDWSWMCWGLCFRERDCTLGQVYFFSVTNSCLHGSTICFHDLHDPEGTPSAWNYVHVLSPEMLPVSVFSHLVTGFCSDFRRGRCWRCLEGPSWVRMTLMVWWGYIINSLEYKTSEHLWTKDLWNRKSKTQGRCPQAESWLWVSSYESLWTPGQVRTVGNWEGCLLG